MKRAFNKHYVFFIYAGLALATLLAFQQACFNDFVNYDDTVYVTEEPLVNAGFTRDGVIWAFTKHLAGNWHPLTSMSHMLDCQLFGLNPAGHHLTGLLLHVVNTLLLFSVVRAMTGALWRSAFVAAAFALHPLHVESVAWISERKDVLSTLFWLLTMAAYLRYVKRPGPIRYMLVLLAFALGLMAKSMVVTLPFVLLLLDYWPLGRFQSDQAAENSNHPDHESVTTWFRWPVFYRLVWEKVPFFVLSAVISVVAFLAERSIGSVGSMHRLPLMVRILSAFVSYVTYIGKMVWPSRLAVFYPYASVLLIWQAAAAGLFLLFISVAVIRAVHRPYLAVGWLWYLGTLMPVIGLVQVGYQALADRYTYIPLIGLFIIIAWGFPDALAKWRYKRTVLMISAVVVLSALAVCTSLQVRHWRNSFTLFEHALDVTADNYAAHTNLANAMFRQGRLEEGITHCLHSIRINPNQAETLYDLGKAFSEQGKADRAIAYYTEALRLRSDYIDAHYNLAMLFADHGRFDEAVSHYNEVLRLDRNHSKAHNNLGVIFAGQGKLDEAVSHYTEALRLDPEHFKARNNLGTIFARKGQLDKAVDHFSKVLRFKPEFAGARRNLAAALVALDRFDDAIEQYTRFLQLEPGDADAHNKLAVLLSRGGQFSRAVTHYTEALRLRPNWPEVLNNLAWLLATHQQAKFYNPSEAIRLAERACQLTDYKRPAMLDTLAAAYAAAGRFSDAVATAEKAADLALASGYQELADDIRSHLELYRTAQPYHRSP